MNLIKKILIVHGDVRIRRRLGLLLADAGFDIRQFSTGRAATESAHGELYDLALVDHELADAPGFAFVGALKQIQPTVPMILVAARLELPLVVQGIRQGLADVIACSEDPRIILRHARAALQLDSQAEGDVVSPEELAEVEKMLDRLSAENGTNPASVAGLPGSEWLRLSKEKAFADTQVERLQREKAALETELKTLLSQGADAQRLHADLVSLQNERELAAATQAAIDEKARRLGEQRAQIASERDALEEARRKVESTRVVGSPAEQDLSSERGEVATWRQRLAAQEDRLAEETDALRREEVRINQERRNLHEELDLFRAREENLRCYEERLRKIQAELEADRVTWFSAKTRDNGVSASPFVTDTALRDAWAKLQRATEIFEAERANLRDDRLALNEHDAVVKRREAKVRDREIQLSMAERRLRELPPPPPPAGSLLKNASRVPFDAMKSLFGSTKKA